jgi:hypothetical protein
MKLERGIMSEPLNHKLDVSKIKTLKDIKNVFECMDLVASMREDNEKYELAKQYFTIPYVPEPLKFDKADFDYQNYIEDYK